MCSAFLFYNKKTKKIIMGDESLILHSLFVLFCFGGFKHIYIVMYTWANVKFLLPWRIIVFVVNIDRKYVILSELGPAEHKRRGLPPRFPLRVCLIPSLNNRYLSLSQSCTVSFTWLQLLA